MSSKTNTVNNVKLEQLKYYRDNGRHILEFPLTVAVFLTMVVGDLASTYWGLANGAVEMNFFMQPLLSNVWLSIIVKLVGLIFILLLINRNRDAGIRVSVLSMVIGVHVAIIVSNVHVVLGVL